MIMSIRALLIAAFYFVLIPAAQAMYFDRETGTNYNANRDYSPEGGRYIESDPVGLEGGHNTYAYVANSPLMLIDPLGLAWLYSQSSGRLAYQDPQTGTITQVSTGYAGYQAGLNNPAQQNVPSVGPIPQGNWIIGRQQANVTGTGVTLPGSMRLTPARGTQTFGRSGFLIHGGNFKTMDSSRGCIVLPTAVRNQISFSNDPQLMVVP